MSHGPYNLKKIAQNIHNNITQTDKNIDLTPEKFAEIADISHVTARSWSKKDYEELDRYLEPPLGIYSDTVNKNPAKIIRVIGCTYGHFQIIAFPISDRIISRFVDFRDRITRFRNESRIKQSMMRKARQKRWFGTNSSF